MIFVTVGTHEQSFNRLLEYIDKLKENGMITEDVVMQIGFSTYEPKFCEWQRLYPYQKMIEMVGQARIVITHGGPASFIMPLEIGKIPVVVPRRKEFGEHVNNHQVDFCDAVVEGQKNIIAVKDIHMLQDILLNYDKIVEKMHVNQESNNKKFCEEFGKLVDGMFDCAQDRK